MLKTIYTITAAAIISARIVALPSLSPLDGQNVKPSASEC
jgi:hypothetical protein